MAKALFGSVVAPSELLAAENASLRARVRRLEEQLAVLREEQRNAAIAHELLSLADESSAPALA
jgi:hypothetical protein